MTQSGLAPALTNADGLIRLFAAECEGDGWRIASMAATEHFDVDATIGIELIDVSVALVHQANGLVTGSPRGAFPVAPDSQLDFIRRSDDVVVSGDISHDTRFVAGTMLESVGIRSSMSKCFDLSDGRLGVFGVHCARPDAFGCQEVEDFRSLVALIGTALSQLRERDRLRHEARVDPLTGVMNRGATLLSLADRLRADGDVCALLIDLDGFKAVNDDHGHAVGDVALLELARRMEGCLAPDDTLGRLGGDEFLAVITDRVGAVGVAERIISHVEEVMLVGRSVVQLSASIGIAIRGAGDDAASMIARADRLMYMAKSGGRGQTRADDTPMVPERRVAASQISRSRGAVLRASVDEAIAGLRMVYQPIVDADTGFVYAYEALTRGPLGHQLEFPALLFSEATTHGRLGELEVAAKGLALVESPDDGRPLFVNLEPELLCDQTWGPRLIDTIVHGARGRPIVAEITERAVLQSPGRLLRAAEACRARGWSVALDDVGSRSDSLAILRCLRPDVVKLDMGLIEVGRLAHAAHVAAAVSAYRESHDVLVVAEGVEDHAQLEHAKVLGADLIQGYLFGRPAPREAWEATAGARADRVPTDAGRQRLREGSKRNMLHLSRHVESVVLSPDCILLAALQHADHFTEQTRRVYSAIARRCGMVGVVGQGMTERWGHAMNGVRIADLAPCDELTKHWNVIVLSPSKSLALLAEEVEQSLVEPGTLPRTDMDRRFTFRLLTDSETVEAAAAVILRHF